MVIALLVAWRTLPDFARIAYRPERFGVRMPFISGIAVVIVCILTFALPGLDRELLLVLEIVVAIAVAGTLAETLLTKHRARVAFDGTIKVIDAYALGADALMVFALLALTVHAARSS